MHDILNVSCHLGGKWLRYELPVQHLVQKGGRDGSSSSLSRVYSFVSFQWTKNRLYPLNPCYIFFLSSCARVWGEDPWSNSRPHSVREMPTHHKAAWVSPKTSLPRTACTPAKTPSVQRAAITNDIYKRERTYWENKVGRCGDDSNPGRGGTVSESLREGRPHDGVTCQQQTSTQQAQRDVELHTKTKGKSPVWSLCNQFSLVSMLSWQRWCHLKNHSEFDRYKWTYWTVWPTDAISMAWYFHTKAATQPLPLIKFLQMRCVESLKAISHSLMT